MWSTTYPVILGLDPSGAQSDGRAGVQEDDDQMEPKYDKYEDDDQMEPTERCSGVVLRASTSLMK